MLFFDVKETGIPLYEKALKQVLKEQQVSNLLAIEQLTWTKVGDLAVQTKTQKFVLGKSVYQQLEIFYEIYQFYQTSKQFAQERNLTTASAFLRVRFAALQQDYEQQVRSIKQKYQVQKKANQIPYQEALALTKWQLEQLENTVEKRQRALLEMEEHYAEEYALVQAAVAPCLQERLDILEQCQENSVVYWEQLQKEKTFIEVYQTLEKQAQKIKHLRDMK